MQENSLKDLIVEIEANLGSVREVLRLRKEFKLTVTNLWANVNGKGAVNIPHLHTGSLLSGVYYVMVPPNSGSLKIMNPNPYNFATFSFFGGLEKFTEGPTPFTTDTMEIVSGPGALVIFPSHLCHYVLPNLSEEKRISLSFNTKITRKTDEKKNTR